ncbi:MAG: N-acetyltransferase [Nodularia sp. (in: Bacteria)]|nr:MAG: N-acetyltransferase [Nodularia sp. (in: cyanobacteria)]
MIIEPQFSEIIIPEPDIDTIYISMNDPKTGKQIGRTESRWYGHWHLGDVWVDINFRRQGLGIKLINETRSRLWAKKLVVITVDAVPQEDSITQEDLNIFYEKAGFKATNTHQRFRLKPY